MFANKCNSLEKDWFYWQYQVFCPDFGLIINQKLKSHRISRRYKNCLGFDLKRMQGDGFKIIFIFNVT